MSTSSDGDDMDWKISRTSRLKRPLKERNRGKSWSEYSEIGEGNTNKKSRANQLEKQKTGNVDNAPENIWKVIIDFGQDGGHYHPIKLTKAIEKEIGKIEFARFMSNKRVLIHATSKQQQEKILKMSSLQGERMKAHIPGAMAKVRGVISGVPLSMSMEDVKNEIQGGKVIEAIRLKSKRDGALKETLSVVVQFERTLPKSVQLGYIHYSVREYIPKPLRCYKCQRLGHTAQQCKGKLRCARCGGQHEYGKCDKDAKIKCCNCGGEHSAAFGGCEVQREAREAQRVKILSKVSYAEVLKTVRETGSNNKNASRMVQRNIVSVNQAQLQTPVHTQVTCDHKCKVGDDTLVVKKVNFVAFICHTINVASQLKKKSDRIKAIVEAAERLLDISDIKADQIHELLTVTENGENVQAEG